MSNYITIKLKRGTAAQWTSTNPVLAEGEVGLETDTRKFKVGTGAAAWNSLQYWGGSGGGAADFTDLGDVPPSYTGQASKFVKVKADESGLEFGTLTIAAGDLPSGIDAAKIADGSVSNTEFQTLNGASATFTSAKDSKLAGIEDNADVTDAANVAAAGAVMESDYNTAHSVLVQQSGSGSPVAVHLGNNTILGKSGGGNIAALSASQVRSLINVEDGADVTDAANVGSVLNAATAKTTPVDADTIPLSDSAASGGLKKLSWANLKATAKAYFDTVYAAIVHTHVIGDVTNLQTTLDGKVDENAAITGATKTKITYDAKGLVTAGADATTADIADSTNRRYVTDAQLTVIGNTSGTNTGDQTITLTGDVTGSGTGSFAATIDKTAITGKTTVTAATGDLVLIADASDSNNLKKVTVDTIAALAGGGSISDGDKGDITVSSSGTVWTVDNDAITYAKLQNVSAASKLLGRGSASGSGDVEEITLGTGLSMSGTTLSATGGGGGGDLTTLYESYTQTGPVNSTTETAVFSYALPTDLVAGDMIEVDMVGTAKNNSGGTRTFDIKWKLGATTILNHNIGFTASATERTFSSKFRVYIVNPANSQKAGVFGMGRDAAPGTFLSPSTGEHPFNGTGYGTAAEDLTSAKTLQATVRFLIANADLYIYCQAVKITKIAAA
jgi:hypothetical protein